MHLKLRADYADPTTGAALPDAILVVSDAQFSLRGGSDILQLAVYASSEAAAAGRDPVSEQSTALSPGEIAAQLPALLQACFLVLMQRPEFNGTQLVP